MGPDKQQSTWLLLLENVGSDSCELVGVVGPQTAKTNGKHSGDGGILINDLSVQVEESTATVEL